MSSMEGIEYYSVAHFSDGSVCGCPELWGINPDTSSHTSSSTTHIVQPSTAITRSLPPQPSLSQPQSRASDDTHRPSKQPPFNPAQYTCFFWYHNACIRTRKSGICPFQHRISPSLRILPPPNYTHRTPCHLPRCPLRTSSSTSNAEKHPRSQAPLTGPGALPLRSPPRHSTKRRSSGQAGTQQTCFFWYHGICGRSRCGFRHGVHASRAVVPPPGYAHRTPCHLPLCPLRVGAESRREAEPCAGPVLSSGSKKAARRKKGRKSGKGGGKRGQRRGKDGVRPLISLHGRREGSPSVARAESPEGAEYFGDEEAPEEEWEEGDWFLDGFPEASAPGEGVTVLKPGDEVEIQMICGIGGS